MQSFVKLDMFKQMADSLICLALYIFLFRVDFSTAGVNFYLRAKLRKPMDQYWPPYLSMSFISGKHMQAREAWEHRLLTSLS